MPREKAMQGIDKAQGMRGFPGMAPASTPPPENVSERLEAQGSGGEFGRGSQEATAYGTATQIADAIGGAAGGWKKEKGASLADIGRAAGEGAARAFQGQQQQQQSADTGGYDDVAGTTDMTPPSITPVYSNQPNQPGTVGTPSIKQQQQQQSGKGRTQQIAPVYSD